MAARFWGKAVAGEAARAKRPMRDEGDVFMMVIY